MSLAELQAIEARFAMPTYRRAPIEFVRGDGARLWDTDGKSYLDFLAGISVTSVGHCHPAVVDAVREQVGRLTHTTNLYYTEPAMRLSERLATSSLGGKVWLANDGAAANECAIKLARKHAHQRGIERPEIVVLEGGFHGRTMGALAATPQPEKQAPFAPMLDGFVCVPRGDPATLDAAVGDRTAAVMIEPIQGESGIFPVPDDVLVTARGACDRTGALLVFDEIQSGMGRTGSLWAYEQTPVRPDVMTSAKALGGGLPIGACVTAPEFGDVFAPGDHGSTFAGGPVACVAALAALGVIDDPALLRRVRELGARFADALSAIDAVDTVRGRGLMLACDLVDGDAAGAGRRLLDAGLVVNVPRAQTLRFLPPLIIDDAELEEALSILRATL